MSETTKEPIFDLDLLPISDTGDVSDPRLTEKKGDEPKGTKYIVFTVDDAHFAIEANKVSEVVRPLPFTPLPNMPDYFLGIANLRGEIISIVDINSLWTSKPHDPQKSKFIIMRSESVNSNLAFKVDKVREIATLPKNEIELINDENSPHVSGVTSLKGTSIMIVDISKTISSIALS